MNIETNEFLKFNLEEAHMIFKSIIGEMKENGVSIDYRELELKEMKCYQEISNLMDKMYYCVLRTAELRENQKQMLDEEYRIYLKYMSLYVVSVVLIRLLSEIYDTSKISEIVKYIIGMFLGSTYMVLMNKDINENRTNTKDKRDLINELKTLKEEYKKDHDIVVREIDGIFMLNDTLWNRLDHEKRNIRYR